MDPLLDQRLQAILDAAEAAAANSFSSDIDILPIRNEIEDMEERLSVFIRENFDALADRIESNRAAIDRLQERLNEVAGAVDVIQAEIPAQ